MQNKMFTGNLFTLLNPYGLLGGLTTVAIFLLHGANFLGLKLEGELRERVNAFAKEAVDCRICSVYCPGRLHLRGRLLGARHRQPRHRPDCRGCRPAGCRLFHQPQDGRLGLYHGRAEHRPDPGHLLLA